MWPSPICTSPPPAAAADPAAVAAGLAAADRAARRGGDRAGPVRAGGHERPHQPRPADGGGQHLAQPWRPPRPRARISPTTRRWTSCWTRPSSPSASRSSPRPNSPSITTCRRSATSSPAGPSTPPATSPGTTPCCCGNCAMIPLARGLFLDSLAASTAAASRMLLVAV